MAPQVSSKHGLVFGPLAWRQSLAGGCGLGGLSQALEADACLDGCASQALLRAARQVVVWGCTGQSLPTAEAAPGTALTACSREKAMRLCARLAPAAMGVRLF